MFWELRCHGIRVSCDGLFVLQLLKSICKPRPQLGIGLLKLAEGEKGLLQRGEPSRRAGVEGIPPSPGVDIIKES